MEWPNNIWIVDYHYEWEQEEAKYMPPERQCQYIRYDIYQKIEKALEKIAALENAKGMRVPLVSGCPSYLMTEDGFEPIHPMLKEGLRIAVTLKCRRSL
jgi:hypothetical protein